MNNRRLILALIGLALFLALVYVVVQSQQSKVTKAEFETILIGKGSTPKWSPDGAKLAFFCGEGWLCYAPFDGKGEIKRIIQMLPRAYNVRFDWIDTTELITYEMQNFRLEGALCYIFRIRTATLNGSETILLMDSSFSYSRPGKAIRIAPYKIWKDGSISYEEVEMTKVDKEVVKRETFKLLRTGKLNAEELKKERIALTRGDIWLESADGTEKRKLTSGKHYRGAHLSPDGSKIISKNSRGENIVLDTLGNEICNFGIGDDQKWSPDGKQIVYEITEQGGEDGAFIVASELYIVNSDCTDKIQITNTPDEIELEPVWSPDGRKIVCFADKTGNIFVIKVK